MLGRVGDDDFGRQMIANLVCAGCGIEGVRIIAGPSGVALILIAESGRELHRRGVRRQRSLQCRCTSRPMRSCCAGARFALLQLEVPMPTTLAAATAARAAGLEVILDPAPAPEHLPAELLKFVDVLTPNETEASLLVGRKTRRT